MKFNKSAESDFWYVGFDDDMSAGLIVESWLRKGYFFEQHDKLSSKEMREVADFMDKLEKERGIDTTSTFTTNSVQS